MARFIDMRDIPQEQMYVLMLFDCLSERDLNLLNVVANELPVDRDCDAARVNSGLNPNHCRVTFRTDQCKLRAKKQALKRHPLRMAGHAETRQT